MSALSRVTDALNACGSLPTAWRLGQDVRCPAHDDQIPSLSVDVGDDGRVLLRCHHGCAFDEIVASLGLTPNQLFSGPAPSSARRQGRLVAAFDYLDLDGELRYQTVRWEPKGFAVRRPNGRREPSDGERNWIWNMGEQEPLPYRLLDARKAIAEGDCLCVAEGEAKVDLLWALGWPATCNPFGANNWRPDWPATFFADVKHVVLFPDNDHVGCDHMAVVAEGFCALGATVSVVRLPGLGEGEDILDWIAQGHAEADLEEIDLEPWTIGAQLEPWFAQEDLDGIVPSRPTSASEMPLDTAGPPVETVGASAPGPTYAIVPGDVIRSGIHPTALKIYSYLDLRGGIQDYPSYGIQHIAGQIGLNRNTVAQHLGDLQAMGLVTIDERQGPCKRDVRVAHNPARRRINPDAALPELGSRYRRCGYQGPRHSGGEASQHSEGTAEDFAPAEVSGA